MRVGEVPETVAGHFLTAAGSPQARSAGFPAFVRRWGGPYRLTEKLMALLLPAVVVTVTFTAPSLAVVGTLHLIRVALQET